MTLFEAFVQRNPFESNAFSRSRKLVFILDQVARLGALDAMGFAERIALSLAVAQRMSEALANTGSALDQQMGATVDSHSAFEDMRRVIGIQFAILQGSLGRGSAKLITLFGRHITFYTEDLTHTNASIRLPILLKSLKNNAAVAGAAAVTTLNAAINTYVTARGDQGGEKGIVARHRAVAASFDPQLNVVLWQNQTAVVDRYPNAADLPQRLAAANYSLLLRPTAGPQASTYADFLAAGSTVDINAESQLLLPAATTRLLLHNPGRVRLQVALGTVLQPFPSSGAVQEMAPGSRLTLTLGDLGDPSAQPLLLVHNPTSELGQYELVLG